MLEVAVALTMRLDGPPRVVETWANYDDVRDLRQEHGTLVAVTEAGELVRTRNGSWKLRSGVARPMPAPQDTVAAKGQGPRLVVELGGESLLSADGQVFAKAPPAEAVYCLHWSSRSLYAGTNRGLFRRKGQGWERERLPSQWPLLRSHGVWSDGGVWLTGGPAGLFLGKPGSWRRISSDPVRQIASDGPVAWVLNGDGSVDKMEPAADRMVKDAFFGSTKRPWASALSAHGGRLVAAGRGGWSDWSVGGKTENWPAALADQVVTAVATSPDTVWLGTQTRGFVRWRAGKLTRWDVPEGLADPWVRALAHTREGLWVGTSDGGLYRLVGETLRRVKSPGPSISDLVAYDGGSLVGTAIGAHWGDGARWKRVGPREEVTAITRSGDSLIVLTNRRAFRLK